MAMATSPAGVTRPATTMSKVAFQAGRRREANPAVTDQCDAYAANRAAERQAAQLGGQRGRVDGDDVVELVRVQRHDGDDHLDLIA